MRSGLRATAVSRFLVFACLCGLPLIIVAV
jgi:hypothetical protein